MRWSIYAILGALFSTGVAWWLLDSVPSVIRLYLIAVHGLAAMAFLILLGAIIALHVREGWRRRLNQVSGVLVLSVTGLLILTAFALYYVGSDVLRSLASVVHISLGFGLPPVLLIHIVFGRRYRERCGSLSDKT